MKKIPFLVLLVFVLLIPLQAQVLGPCGSGGETALPQSGATKTPVPGLTVSPVPLPGQQAMDFQLTAVVGNDIKDIKLSDYDGKWRVVCFFPAAFTFV
jgi:hypothetical protein